MQDHDSTSPSPDTTHRYACIKCGYDVSGIDPHGACPECNTPIISTCITCDYDLSGTAPEAPCPECGTPVSCSMGNSALGEVPTQRLKSVHTGFRLVTNGILIYIVSIITTMILTFVIVNNPNLNYPFTAGAAIINNGLIIMIIAGWLKLSAPLEGLTPRLDAADKRSFNRVMLWIFAGTTALTLIYGLIPSDPLQVTTVDIVFGIISLLSLVVMLLVFISNVMYMGWFAMLVRNRKMARRSKHFVWYGPLIAIVGMFIFFIGPLITLVLYWNQIEYVRRDLKKVIQARKDN